MYDQQNEGKYKETDISMKPLAYFYLAINKLLLFTKMLKYKY